MSDAPATDRPTQLTLHVDAWSPDYATPAGAPGGGPIDPPPVDQDVETATADWSPIPVTTAPASGDVLFIDGVRRIDAQVWITDTPNDGSDPTTRPGIAVSYAAGSVRSNGRAVLEQAVVRRGLFARGGEASLRTRHAHYPPRAVTDDDAASLSLAVQKRMGELEVEIAATSDPAELVVIDGPLTGRQNIPGAVGYVKTHHVAYLDADGQRVVTQLKPGERTPIFLTQTKHARWSWYLRLPGPAGHPWAGIVRCEASADLPIEQARARADLTSATLPRFASQEHRDPRAPQNLVPVGELERTLRRRLGDATLLYRSLRAAAITPAF